LRAELRVCEQHPAELELSLFQTSRYVSYAPVLIRITVIDTAVIESYIDFFDHKCFTSQNFLFLRPGSKLGARGCRKTSSINEVCKEDKTFCFNTR